MSSLLYRYYMNLCISGGTIQIIDPNQNSYMYIYVEVLYRPNMKSCIDGGYYVDPI